MYNVKKKQKKIEQNKEIQSILFTRLRNIRIN